VAAVKGALRHTPGIIALVSLARERGLHTVYVPAIDAREATLLGGLRVMPVPTLAAHMRSEGPNSSTLRRQSYWRRCRVGWLV
jgi:magnesium chelatase family protein